MDYNIEGKLAIVFGGSQGIGLGVAKSLAAEGARLILVSRSGSKLRDAVRQLALANGRVEAVIEADVSSPYFEQEIRANTIDIGLKPQIVVNNAGGPKMSVHSDLTDEDWRYAFDLSVMSVVRSVRLFAPEMNELGWGRFINITSTNAIEPTSPMVLSSTLRSGVLALTKSISYDLMQNGITINSICPGGVKTARFEELANAAAEREGEEVEVIVRRSEAGIPMGRLASPDEIGDLVAFLASERSAYITGRSFVIDGGLTKSF